MTLDTYAAIATNLSQATPLKTAVGTVAWTPGRLSIGV